MYTYNAKILNVVDGDTFDMDVDLGFHVHIHVRTRLLNVDTPENRGSDRELGKIVTDYAKQLLTNQDVIIESLGPEIDVYSDSFGRWLVKIYHNDKLLEDTYNELGVNKSNESYSDDNVRLLTDLI